jgi:hypothetical protein
MGQIPSKAQKLPLQVAFVLYAKYDDPKRKDITAIS